MSSPCLSGGGRTYGFDLELMKSPSSSITRTTSSSPSSTISESSNSPLTISTRKPRTPRKRPNQIYNEAAALLSTAYPSIFSTQQLNQHPRKFSKPHQENHATILLDESLSNSSELLWPPLRVFDENSGFLVHQSEKPSFLKSNLIGSFYSNSNSYSNSCNSTEEVYEEDNLDAESILDEEIQEGIDSIMGNFVENSHVNNVNYFGGKFQMGSSNGIRKGVTAFRHGNRSNWWSFPIVDMLQISPRLSRSSSCIDSVSINESSDKKGSNLNSDSKSKKMNSGEKRKKKVEKVCLDAELVKENSIAESNSSLLLKLNYDGVLNAWSDRASPFSDDISGSEGGNDVSIGTN
ncbi:protein CHLOROPLAST IMPORT APPARATUS 2 isoform X2 [Mercurialis annua]|uniref:protein CHLOROPLAST IMPORT APPARATUS 2 isoform X2 n=1 Tax=Mercurialis annua TaxID=3986 RepID=UPI0021603D9E|nr:protein CHLOROPLAST IMPORT APPARATUS 2 isoform X2 [Mercurialis annua]